MSLSLSCLRHCRADLGSDSAQAPVRKTFCNTAVIVDSNCVPTSERSTIELEIHGLSTLDSRSREPRITAAGVITSQPLPPVGPVSNRAARESELCGTTPSLRPEAQPDRLPYPAASLRCLTCGSTCGTRLRKNLTKQTEVTTRQAVGLAIGQLYDYRRFVPVNGRRALFRLSLRTI
jgi:hypothetical protein